MKKLVCLIIGVIVFGAICVGLTWLIGAIWGPLYSSEDEANRNFGYFLIAFSVSIFVGGWLGFLFGGKATNKAKH